MQIEANLRVQGGSRGCGRGPAGTINFGKVRHMLLGKPVPFHLETMKNEKEKKKRQKKKQKPFHMVKNDEVHTDFVFSLFR